MDESNAPIIESVSARAALAGNPSDGYSGAVFAVPVPADAATVRLDPIASGHELVDAHSGHRRFDRWSDVERSFAPLTSTSPHCLVLAAMAEVAARNGMLRPCRLTVETTIPMSVGLAGSSAIVIASMRALMRFTDDAMTADELAVAALSVEAERLGIAAGLQDRVVQAHGRPMLMRFDPDSSQSGPGEFAPVRPGRPLRLIVASRASTSEPSQVVHGDLRERFVTGEESVTQAMPTLAALAVDAAAGFEGGDVARLGAAMDATFDVRASILDLAPGHVEMVEATRAVGAHANYTGSGGSVIVLSPTAVVDNAVRQSLKRLGCTVVTVDVGGAASAISDGDGDAGAVD